MPLTASLKARRWRLCVAPMLDWTDRHCRYFHRLLSQRALLYTEMVTTGALLHGDVARHLRHDAAEQPLALQLGGSSPAELARCAQLGAQWGYAEINLNCGCPSAKVQRGAFGACLMTEPSLVADCVRAMVASVGIPITVKHRIGIDRIERYDFVRDFVGTVSQAGCQTFIVHARNAWLQGLSPKDNRDIPPLRYDWVYQLKRDFPALTIVINGGITTSEAVQQHLTLVDGVMVGRAAYHDPWWLSQWDQAFFAEVGSSAANNLASRNALTRELIEQRMVDYMLREAERDGTPWWNIARHMLGLWHGQPGARHWRRVWSDHTLHHRNPRDVMALAHDF